MFSESWKSFLKVRSNILKLIFNFILLFSTLCAVTTYLNYNEQRTEVVKLNDPVLNTFTAVDLDTYAFILMYISIVSFFVFIAFRPKLILIAFTSYSIVALTRIFMMYLTPLDVPDGAIYFHDPIVTVFGGGTTFMKDLFFSGHTSLMVLLTLITFKYEKSSDKISVTGFDKYYKYFLLAGTILVAYSVLMQKAHYAVDVAVAPFIAYTAYRISIKIYKL